MTYEGEEPIEVNGKKVVAFKESGEWTVPDGVTEVDVLVVAGGGSGGWASSRCGGGGAGELVFSHNYDVLSGKSIDITVGEGGIADGDADPRFGNNGEDSIFDDLVAKGGGSGGRYEDPGSDENGADGGSGGGARGSSSTSGSGGSSTASLGYGNRGGNNVGSGVAREGGGGGGAGEPGMDASNSGTTGHGGDGLYEVEIDGTTYNFASIFGTEYGEVIDNEAWFAGGGGSTNNSGNSYPGGKGGGGDGNSSDGLSNTGGGAGGNQYTGGSGVVLIAYEELPFTIKGIVNLNASPVEGAIVRLFNQDENTYITHDVTNASGEYSFEALEEGVEYHVTVEYLDEATDDKYYSKSAPFIQPWEDEE